MAVRRLARQAQLMHLLLALVATAFVLSACSDSAPPRRSSNETVSAAAAGWPNVIVSCLYDALTSLGYLFDVNAMCDRATLVPVGTQVWIYGQGLGSTKGVEPGF